jgi:hypothetical protein
MKYLNPTDDGAFVDFPEPNKKPEWAKNWVKCPLCMGYGGWNLSLNAYSLHGKENTPENRHRYSHFKSHCGQCNGYGWTSVDNAKCIHEMQHYRNVGNCLNEYKCLKCGKTEVWDSSG